MWSVSHGEALVVGREGGNWLREKDMVAWRQRLKNFDTPSGLVKLGSKGCSSILSVILVVHGSSDSIGNQNRV